MEYTAEHLKKITSLGTLSYGLEKCLNVLDIKNEEQFKKDFRTPGTPVYKAYKKGQDISDFAIDSKLFNLAKEGDLEALKELNERKIKRQLEDEDNFFNENS